MIDKEKVFSVHGRKCVYCGQPATTVDHLRPVSIGGTDEFENLAPCCTTCNTRKGNRTAEEHIRYIALMGARQRVKAILEDAQRRIVVELDAMIKNNMGKALFAMDGIDRIMLEKFEHCKGEGK